MFVTRLPLLHNVFVRFVYCQILAANKLQYDDTFLAWNIIPGWRLHAASGNRAAKAFAQVLRPPTSPYLPLMTTFLAPVLCCYHWMQESGLVEKIRNVSRIFCTSTCSFTSWAEVGHHNRRLHTRLKPGYFETVKVSLIPLRFYASAKYTACLQTSNHLGDHLRQRQLWRCPSNGNR